MLQGAVNLEQSRLVTATDLARFTGPVVAGIEPQRERLREMAGVETVVELYAANARLLADGPGRGTVFYYDPHSKEYSGDLTVLKGQLHTAENALAKRLLQRERQQDLLLAAEQRAEELRAEKASVLAQVRRALAGLQADAGKLGDSVALRRHGDRLMADLRSLRREASRARRALAKLDALIAPLKQQTADLETRLAAAIRNQSRLQLPIDNHYRLLDSRCKATLDALRIAASNLFADLATRFRPLYGNHRNDHVMLRQLSRADGFLHRDGQTVYVRLWLRGRFQDWQTRAFRRFLAEVSEGLSRLCAPTGTQVRVTLLSTPPAW